MIRTLERASQLTALPILLRLDGGNDSIENIDVLLEHNLKDEQDNIDFIIKWNPRKKDPEHWLEQAEEHGGWVETRPGKRVSVFEIVIERE